MDSESWVGGAHSLIVGDAHSLIVGVHTIEAMNYTCIGRDIGKHEIAEGECLSTSQLWANWFTRSI